MNRIVLVVAVILLAVPSLSAQEGWEAGAWGGTSFYFGDLNTAFRLDRPGLGGGVAARYNVNNRICLKLGASYGQISASDADSDNVFERARNLDFQSDLGDFTTQLEFNFLPYTHGNKDEFFTPYLFAGFTVFYFNPITEYEGEFYELRNLGTEGQFKGEEYTSVNAGWAYGAGFKIDLNYRWSLNLELSARRLFTDYLDDVSTVYPDLEDLAQLRGPIAVALADRSIELPGIDTDGLGDAGRQRGNSIDNDSYVFLGLGLMYYFGDLKCPGYGSR